MRKIVFPGTEIDRSINTEYSYTEFNKKYISVLSMYDSETNTIIPLEGFWHPNLGEKVVGVVVDYDRSKIYVELSSFVQGVIELPKHFDNPIKIDKGELVEATVSAIQSKVEVSLLFNKILDSDGIVIRMPVVKMPRVIGKNNTMISQIIEYTKSNIIVGMNGVIWLKGGNADLALKAFEEINKNAHIHGLTNKIKEMLTSSK
ncbi:MAG: KH domain-containing protein [Candidatus Micrarchaeia archaeon]